MPDTVETKTMQSEIERRLEELVEYLDAELAHARQEKDYKRGNRVGSVRDFAMVALDVCRTVGA
jgi:predicted aldo/keto reductase-like oxidoreductase